MPLANTWRTTVTPKEPPLVARLDDRVVRRPSGHPAFADRDIPLIHHLALAPESPGGTWRRHSWPPQSTWRPRVQEHRGNCRRLVQRVRASATAVGEAWVRARRWRRLQRRMPLCQGDTVDVDHDIVLGSLRNSGQQLPQPHRHLPVGSPDARQIRSSCVKSSFRTRETVFGSRTHVSSWAVSSRMRLRYVSNQSPPARYS